MDDGKCNLLCAFAGRICIHFVERRKRAKEASEIMKITALDLKSLGVIEQIIPEYGVADAKACESISRYLKGNIKSFLRNKIGQDRRTVCVRALCEIPEILAKSQRLCAQRVRIVL